MSTSEILYSARWQRFVLAAEEKTHDACLYAYQHHRRRTGRYSRFLTNSVTSIDEFTLRYGKAV